MRCPFLREEQVKSCQVAPFRKSLARSSATGAGELCTSADHRSCPALRESHEAHPDASRCPFLHESLVQFCAASPRPTYVPWSESPDLRCAHDGHRYCELFLTAGGRSARGPARRRPPLPRRPRRRSSTACRCRAGCYYADNHTWLDVGDDGLCHLGVDAFLTRLVGEVEQPHLPHGQGRRAPGGRAHRRRRGPHPRLRAAAAARGRQHAPALGARPPDRRPLRRRLALHARGGTGTPSGPSPGARGRARVDGVGGLPRSPTFVHEQLVRAPRWGALPADGGRPPPTSCATSSARTSSGSSPPSSRCPSTPGVLHDPSRPAVLLRRPRRSPSPSAGWASRASSTPRPSSPCASATRSTPPRRRVSAARTATRSARTAASRGSRASTTAPAATPSRRARRRKRSASSRST